MTSPFEAFFEAQGVVILDGGLATELEAAGHDLADPLWSARVLLEAPADMARVHRAYLEAGADCIATGTYQATFPGLHARGLGDDQVAALLRGAVRMAVEERDAFWAHDRRRADGRLRPLVAASVGPYGAWLADGSEYRGDYGLAEGALADWHRERWRILAASDADLLACETIPSLPEVRALVRLFGETPGARGWISLQCRDDRHLADGTPVEEAVAACREAEGVVAVSVNCVPPAGVAPLLDRMGPVTGLPLGAYPNAGDVWDASGRRWVPHPRGEAIERLAPAWVGLGARLVGGCCRTGPETVRRIRRALVDCDTQDVRIRAPLHPP